MHRLCRGMRYSEKVEVEMFKVSIIMVFGLYVLNTIRDRDLYTHLLMVILISLFVGYIIGKRDN